DGAARLSTRSACEMRLHRAAASEARVETAVIVVTGECEVVSRVVALVREAAVALAGGDDLAVRLDHERVRGVVALRTHDAGRREREVGQHSAAVSEGR